MKAIFALALTFFASQAFAGDNVCYNNSNSDLEIRLVFADSALTQVSWVNQDWGAAGYGDLQKVAVTNNANEYIVTEQNNAFAGFYKGTIIRLNYSNAVLQSAQVFSSSGSTQSADYRCF